MAHVELGPRAVKDVRRAKRSGEGGRIEEAVASLEREDQGLDIVPLQGRAPWRRMRSGDWRIIFRPLDAQELRALGLKGSAYLVARIVNRRDLDRAVQNL